MKHTTDILHMKSALHQAEIAFELGEVPVGAVVCDGNGIVIASAHNRMETDIFAGAHAEVLAIQEASNKIGSWRLNECSLYVTLEPCPMCISLSVLSRLKRVVFGCSDSRMGACGSLFNLAQHPELPHQLDIQGGILEDECKGIIESFFQTIRKQKR